MCCLKTLSSTDLFSKCFEILEIVKGSRRNLSIKTSKNTCQFVSVLVYNTAMVICSNIAIMIVVCAYNRALSKVIIYRSRAMSHFYETEVEIWAALWLAGSSKNFCN